MYKAISIILSLILLVSLPACGTPAGSGSSAGSGSAAAPENTVELSGEISGEINVTAYDSMRTKAFLEDAARLFEEKYPGTKVNVETFSAMPEIKTSEQGNTRMIQMEDTNDPQARQDYINKVNTALMSGKGADVMCMDVLSVQKLVDAGHLENLAAYMESDAEFDRGDYRANILDAVVYKNGTWFMPMDYSFDYYAYDSTLLSGDAAASFGENSAFTAEALIGIAEPYFDGSSKLFNSVDYFKGARAGASGMWGNLLEENYASFVDIENKTANFDDGRFEALLETVKEYSAKGYVTEGASVQRDGGQRTLAGPGQGPTERFFYKSKNIFSLTSRFTRDIGLRTSIMMGGGVAGIEDDDEIAGIRANADGSVPFTCEQAYAINSGSPNKETAWEFIKFLLSEEMQLNSNLTIPTSLPVNNAARAKKAESVFSSMDGKRGQAMRQASESTGTDTEADTELMDEKLSAALGEYNKAVERLSESINAYVLHDTVVDDMIASEVAYFFEGTKSAAEVAGVLQSKVDLYLNE